MMRADRIQSIVSSARGAGTPIVVLGDGPDADDLRDALPTCTGTPATVIETTGTTEGLREALAAVEDLGTVVLAGPSPDPDPTLDLYGDLHVRGLTIIGAEAPIS